jgi:hypothetical protein
VQLSVAALVLLLLPVSAYAQDFNWAGQLSGTQDNGANGVAVDSSGNVYAVGSFEGTVDFDPGPGTYNLTSLSPGWINAYVSVLDSAGNFVWARQLGGATAVSAWDVAVDASGNVYTVGIFLGTVDFDPGPGTFNLTSAGYRWNGFISVLDSAGNFVWAGHLAGNLTLAKGVAVGGGHVYIVGHFSGTVDFDPGPGTFNLQPPPPDQINAFLTVLDNAGNFVWAGQWGGYWWSDIVGDSASDVAVGDNGDVYTAGTFRGTADFDPGPGTFYLTSAGDHDAFVSVFDSVGNFVWARQLGGTTYDAAEALVVDTGGNVYIVGDFQGTADFDPGPGTFNLISAGWSDAFIAVLDSAGNFVWAKRLGGTNWVAGQGAAVDASGNVYTFGIFLGTADFDPGPGTFNLTSAGSIDAFVSVLDAAGDFVWAGQLGGAEIDQPEEIALDTVGNAYIVGTFRGTADFDPGPGTFNLTSAGSSDAFVASYSLVLRVEIDIRPNSINPRSRGVTPVVLLGSEDFSVEDIDVTTLRFGRDQAAPAHDLTDEWTYNDHLEDVNLDGHMDLVAHFRMQDTGIACGDEAVTLTGSLLSGQSIEGTDSIRTVGCRSSSRSLFSLRRLELMPDTDARVTEVELEDSNNQN